MERFLKNKKNFLIFFEVKMFFINKGNEIINIWDINTYNLFNNEIAQKVLFPCLV